MHGGGKPLVPWSQRNLGPPKNSNGWSWGGDGIEQKVYLNVSSVSTCIYSTTLWDEGQKLNVFVRHILKTDFLCSI